MIGSIASNIVVALIVLGVIIVIHELGHFLAAKWAGVRVDRLSIGPTALDEALAATPPLLREALEEARAAILAYHRSQLRDDATHEREGVTVRELARPVDRAGVYVPGGRAPLLSTVLMTAIPARVAAGPLRSCCRRRIIQWPGHEHSHNRLQPLRPVTSSSC